MASLDFHYPLSFQCSADTAEKWRQKWKKTGKENCLTLFWRSPGWRVTSETQPEISSHLTNLLTALIDASINASGKRLSHCLVLTNTHKLACTKHAQHSDTQTSTAHKLTYKYVHPHTYQMYTVHAHCIGGQSQIQIQRCSTALWAVRCHYRLNPWSRK